MIQLTLTLTIIAAVAGVSISAVFEKTKEVIASQKSEQLNSSLESLFPEGVLIAEDTLQLQNGESMRFWVAEKTDFMSGDSDSSENSPYVGFAFEGGKYGYSSVVKYIVAVTTEGKLLGLSILSQEETPGLGSRSTESVSDLTFWNGLFKKKEKSEPWFQSQFAGLSIGEPIAIKKEAEWHTLDEAGKVSLMEKNSVTAITGATITTKAVTDALLSQSTILKEITAYLSSNGGSDD